VEGPGPGARRDTDVPPGLVGGGRQVRLGADAETGGRRAQAVGRPEHQQSGTVGQQVRGGGQGAVGSPTVPVAVAQTVRLVHPVRAAEIRTESCRTGGKTERRYDSSGRRRQEVQQVAGKELCR